MRSKVLIVFGTRPEAIKMAPLVKEFKLHAKSFDVKVCVTAQHREMLDQVLNFFDIIPDYDLNIMKPGQNLFHLTADVITGMKPVIEAFNPDYIFVHGDTTTSTATALAGFYAGVTVCHVEAGLRTHNIHSPFPEEMNRQITGRIAGWHYAPTEKSKYNLATENISNTKILVVGNTVIDALFLALEKLKNYEDEEILFLKKIIDPNKKIILVTGHRRENFGEGFKNICIALKDVSELENVQVIYPVHLNPNVKNIVFEMLGNADNINLINPLSYPAFVWLMNRSYVILTDSGGIQEEGPSLGKPILVMRNTTERPEAVDGGTAKLVGTDVKKIVYEVKTLLNDKSYYESISSSKNPYGDGTTSKQIIDHLLTIKL
ncbi:non-hydrolyzing UDP-N-acetylglucosamine 2-epimerase [Pedobacter namyangjuensis]|uniref:non-hydrolyzing UDP-N-acetylglucosamine 2-epimerase n=1 Tax=Pedobacter namyangjuensis TaxID=600626 RepID=UPI000DE3B888|nr:UDP-N-acetylglucosamine 2-epimerase (non-hydrolyzing) [Pedobacter namyangjuensis]